MFHIEIKIRKLFCDRSLNLIIQYLFYDDGITLFLKHVRNFIDVGIFSDYYIIYNNYVTIP